MAQMAKKSIDAGMVIDASHGNSNKDYRRQPIVVSCACLQTRGFRLGCPETF